METARVDELVYKTADIFEGHLDLPGKSIQCPNCEVFYPASEWTAYDTDCETCGGHPILGCPTMEHFFDPFHGDGATCLLIEDSARVVELVDAADSKSVA